MKVNKNTRASGHGRKIYCPKCNAPSRVYHFSWSAIQCGTCDNMIDKYDWSLEAADLPTETGIIEAHRKFLAQDPGNWKWLIAFYVAALLLTILLTIKI